MKIKLLSGALGAEIKGIDLKDTSNENFKKINDLLLEHKVIFFRDQTITAEQHIALAEKFGAEVPTSPIFEIILINTKRKYNIYFSSQKKRPRKEAFSEVQKNYLRIIPFEEILFSVFTTIE